MKRYVITEEERLKMIDALNEHKIMQVRQWLRDLKEDEPKKDIQSNDEKK